MVGAKDLNYDSVIEALEKGDFYMSCGPEITDVYMEGNVLKVACSDAQRINLESHGRMAKVVIADDVPLQEAEFDLENFFSQVDRNDPNVYVYVTVTASDGSYATTRAFYLNELI